MITAETIIQNELQYVLLPHSESSCTASITGSKGAQALAVAPHGVILRESSWTFPQSRCFKDFMELRIHKEKWRGIPATESAAKEYTMWIQKGPSLNSSQNVDDGREPFVQAHVGRIVDFACGILKVVVIQIMEPTFTNDQEFIEFLEYIFSIKVMPQAAREGVIPDIVITMGDRVLGTFELKGTRYNDLASEKAPSILNQWFVDKGEVKPAYGSGGELEHAWSVLAQLMSQATTSEHGMGVFTTLLGALYIYRFERNSQAGKPGILHISPNLASKDNAQNRDNPETLKKFAINVIAFLLNVLLKESTFREYLQKAGWQPELFPLSFGFDERQG